MIYYALVFLVVALIAGVLGFSGIAGTAANIAWILFVVGLVLAVVFFVRGRGSSIYLMAGQGRCSHLGCSCTVQEPHAVLQNGKAYCSDGCAAGQGCAHGACSCGQRAATSIRSD